MRNFFVFMFAVIGESVARADVVVYNNKSDWIGASPEFSTITFTELPVNTWITDQYSGLGIYFTDGSDLVHHSANFVTDSAGLNGALDETTLQFDGPMTTIAADFPGMIQIKLFSRGELLYTSPLLGSAGTGFFGGLISTSPFDEVQITDPLGGLFIDNLYFGPPIPAPGALAFLGLAALTGNRRRRRT